MVRPRAVGRIAGSADALSGTLVPRALEPAVERGLLPIEPTPADVAGLLAAGSWRQAVERAIGRNPYRVEVRELARRVVAHPGAARWVPLRLYRVITFGQEYSPDHLSVLDVLLADVAGWVRRSWTMRASDQLIRLLRRAEGHDRLLLVLQLLCDADSAADSAGQLAEIPADRLPSRRQLTQLLDRNGDVHQLIGRSWLSCHRGRPVPPEHRRQHGFLASNRWQLALPRDVEDIRRWSEGLNNCLADGYAWRIVNGRCLVVGLIDAGRRLRDGALPLLLAEHQPSTGDMQRLLGADNRIPDADEALAAWQAVAETGLARPIDDLGRPKRSALDRVLRLAREPGVGSWSDTQQQIALQTCAHARLRRYGDEPVAITIKRLRLRGPVPALFHPAFGDASGAGCDKPLQLTLTSRAPLD